jgi:hypothetical protein
MLFLGKKLFHAPIYDFSFLKSSFQQDQQPLILSPLDEVWAVLQNIVKSLGFIESVQCPIAPILGENVAKLSSIAGNTMDLGILHFLGPLGPGESSRPTIRNFH